MEVRDLRRKYITAQTGETKLALLDTEIKMVRQAAGLLKIKGALLRLALAVLDVSSGLVAAGTLIRT